MPILVTAKASKDTIDLGQTVTVTYSCKGAMDCCLQADNLPNPIYFGNGNVEGSIKLLPTANGDFNVTVTGIGDASQRNAEDSEFASIKVIVK